MEHIEKCPECGKEYDEKDYQKSYCHGCGHPVKRKPQSVDPVVEVKPVQRPDVTASSQEQSETVTTTTKRNSSSVAKFLMIMAVIFFVCSGYFFMQGHDVKNNYYNSEYGSLNQNAYVGGDAYNYIINGTYFTGYSVLGSAFMVGGVVMMSSGCIVKAIESKEE